MSRRRLPWKIGAVGILVVAFIVLGVMLLMKSSHSKADAPTTSATLETEGPLPIGSFNSCGAGKRVALTFDDGPLGTTTLEVLADLRAAGLQGKATFFLSPGSGDPHDGHEECDVIKQILADGHEIQSHTYTHRDMVHDAGEGLLHELQRVENWVKEFCGIQVDGDNMRLFRPPFGSFNKDLRELANSKNYTVSTWNIDSLDWSSKSSEEVMNRVTGLVKDQQGLGQESFVMLFHDRSFFPGVYRRIRDLFGDSYKFVKASSCYRACKKTFCASNPGYDIWE